MEKKYRASHWRNSAFQIQNFLAGNCHTVDAAYLELVRLWDERTMALNAAKVAAKKLEAKYAEHQETLEKSDVKLSELLTVEAELLEVEINKAHNQNCITDAETELAFIEALLEQLEPLRKYKDRPPEVAHQLIQQEEWRYELIERTKDYVLTTGTIPADHFRTMRNHPEYKTMIEPIIKHSFNCLQGGTANLGNPDAILNTSKTPMQTLLSEGTIDIPLLASGDE